MSQSAISTALTATFTGGLDDTAGEEATAEHHLPQMFDLERVCTNEKRFKRANDFG